MKLTVSTATWLVAVLVCQAHQRRVAVASTGCENWHSGIGELRKHTACIKTVSKVLTTLYVYIFARIVDDHLRGSACNSKYVYMIKWQWLRCRLYLTLRGLPQLVITYPFRGLELGTLASHSVTYINIYLLYKIIRSLSSFLCCFPILRCSHQKLRYTVKSVQSGHHRCKNDPL